jgi:primosomal protein N' (replication factor Y) (superfamily II helicase)
VTMKGPVEERVSFSGEAFVKVLQPELSKQVVLAGPAPAPLARAKGFYRYQIILRAPTTKLVTAPLKKVMKTFKWPEGVTCAIDVDAVSLM